MVWLPLLLRHLGEPWILLVVRVLVIAVYGLNLVTREARVLLRGKWLGDDSSWLPLVLLALVPVEDGIKRVRQVEVVRGGLIELLGSVPLMVAVINFWPTCRQIQIR